MPAEVNTRQQSSNGNSAATSAIECMQVMLCAGVDAVLLPCLTWLSAGIDAVLLLYLTCLSAGTTSQCCELLQVRVKHELCLPRLHVLHRHTS